MTSNNGLAGSWARLRDSLVLSLTRVPYDINALETGHPNQSVRWPVDHGDVRTLNADLQAVLIRAIRRTDDEDVRDVLVIAANVLMVSLLTCCTAKLTADRSSERPIEFVFGQPSPTQAFLGDDGGAQGDVVFETVAARFDAALQRRPRNLPWRQAHRLVTNRGLGWPWRPPVTVLNHNGLLQRTARADAGHRFGFATADQLFDQAETAPASASLRRRLDEAAGALASEAATCLEALQSHPTDAFPDGMRRRMSEWLATVAGHRERMSRAWKKPPKELWTGTGGNYVSRLARAAVRRAGGSVSSFEHGGGGHIHKDATPLHLQEFVLADRFVVDTPAKVSVYSKGLDPAKSIDAPPPEVVASGHGGASFHWLGKTAPGPVKRVMYVTTGFVDDLQYPLLPLLPDVVYAEWQGRLLDGLAAQGFEVLCKQHPETARGGRPLVMTPNAEYLRGYFLDCLDEADAFVFDYPATTSLWEAMCTSKPVAFIDLGLAEWLPEVWRDFVKRCAVVQGSFDGWNRPQVDFALLRDALHSAPFDTSYVEKYLTGYAV